MGSRRAPVVRTTRAYRPDDGWEAVVLASQGLAAFGGWCWRARTELTGLLVLAVVGPVLWGIGERLVAPLVGWAVGPVLGQLFAPLPLAAVLAVLLAWPPSRRWLLARWACARSRRRIIAVLRETRVPDSRDRLPIVRRVRPTAVGERLELRMRPGQSAELLAAHIEALRAGARARDVTISRDPARADRVYVDVIRRDLLDTPEPLRSPLLERARHLAAVPTSEGAPLTAIEGTVQ